MQAQLKARTRPDDRSTMVHITCAALLVIIFIIDWQTPLGVAEWVLYLLPVGLCVFQRSRWLPYALALAGTVLIALGYVISPGGGDPTRALISRSMGTLTMWGLAVAIAQALHAKLRVERLMWLGDGESTVAQHLLGEQRIEDVAAHAAEALCVTLGAQTAVVYRLDGTTLHRVGGYAFDPAGTPERISVPDGVAGQVARSGKPVLLHDLNEDLLRIDSALSRGTPRHVIVAPLSADTMVCGIVELGFLRRSDNFDLELELLQRSADAVGVAMRSAAYRQRLESLLEQTQRQGETLRSQQEELRVSNEELEEQSRVLRDSQAQLESQQVELEQTNVQLEEQTQALERQKHVLLTAQQALQANSANLETASRYKSEFLANMSHELRTPLNSSLILSKLLADNKPGTLTPEQVRYAQAIHASNNDLLLLINDILDLSKIEAGHVELQPEVLVLDELVERLKTTFEPLAQQRALAFSVTLDGGAPASIVSDAQRLQQVLTNLLANAIKFTETGAVTLEVRAHGTDRIRFAVRDTGVGIAAHQQEMIFEAFRQADGTTSRRFGGTGLGLSISRELAQRLGGSISVASEPGQGSTFTVELPQTFDAREPARGRSAIAAPPAAAVEPAAPAPLPAAAETTQPAGAGSAVVVERRHPGRLILAVEDDPRFAEVLKDLAEELGFDCVVAPTGSDALALARELLPSGILLDIGLPDQSGLSVLERLKRDPATRHLPVHMISGQDRTLTALQLGAVGYVVKPADREQLVQAIESVEQRLQRRLRRVLIVEDDPALRHNLVLLLQADEVEIVAVGTMTGALAELEGSTFDCMVMDLTLPDGSGDELLENMARGDRYGFPPVIVYTGRALSHDEEHRLRRHSKSIIVKGARSPERLLDEVTLFLHSVESRLPPEQQRLLAKARQRDAVLDGRRILLAEDDVRNIFALTSVFEPLGVKLEIARNGREALQRLDQDGSIDLVLMDIMMPEMDGLTAMRLIRERPHWAGVPIIALTAKAMSDDRERCLEAGANDYVAKPIDVDKLVSLCRVWMPK